MPLVYVLGPAATPVGVVMSTVTGDLKNGPKKGQMFRRVVVQTKKASGEESGLQSVYVDPDLVAKADPREGDEVEWEVEFDARTFNGRTELTATFLSDPAAAPSSGTRAGSDAGAQLRRGGPRGA
jgi:hypothetical protein